MTQAVARHQDARAGFGLDGVARLDIRGAVVPDDLPIGSSRQDTPVQPISFHGSAENIDDPALTIRRAAQIGDSGKVGTNLKNRLRSQHGGHSSEPLLSRCRRTIAI
jgi:hypothetical protein